MADQRGRLIVHTGDGKGKSTAALGVGMRAAGHGLRVRMLQFMKDPEAWRVGEWQSAQRLPGFTIEPLGEGFTWEHESLSRDIAAARTAWQHCQEALQDPAVHLVILDELNYVIAYGFLTIAEVLPALKGRPAHQHVIVTGRDAHPDLIALADTVTEMRKIKHAYDAGILAAQGIEF